MNRRPEGRRRLSRRPGVSASPEEAAGETSTGPGTGPDGLDPADAGSNGPDPATAGSTPTDGAGAGDTTRLPTARAVPPTAVPSGPPRLGPSNPPVPDIGADDPTPAGDTAGGAGLVRLDRRALLALVAAVAVLSAVIGWVAGQRIKSPAEIAAEQQPPAPSVITAAQEQRVLSQDVVARGTVRAGDATELTVTAPPGAEAIVTRLPIAAGSNVEEGLAVIEVSGRPVIALQGALPAFRNLIPTLQGPDVLQLEEALARLGFDPGPVDAVYDQATAGAVDRLYRAAGYTPPETSSEDAAAASAAEELVSSRQTALTAAEDALDQATEPVQESTRLQLDQSVNQADAGLASARVASDQAKSAAATDTTGARDAVGAATSAQQTARSRYDQAAAGTHPDTGAPPTADEVSALQAELDQADAGLAAANDQLAAAEAVEAATTTEQDQAVRDAESTLAIARATRSETLAAGDVAGLRTDVSSARQALDSAEADLADANAKQGAWMPVGEVVFLSTMPRQVQQVNVEVGATPSGPVMTIAGADTVVRSGVSAADKELIQVGAEATLDDPDLDLSVPARVAEVADTPGGVDLSDDRYGLELVPIEPLPPEALNVNLRVSIPVSSSDGEVLVAPLAALSAAPDGAARVEVQRADGSTEMVPVRTGIEADGYVEIAPLGGAVLGLEDRVVVGADSGGAGDGSSSARNDTGDDEPGGEGDDGDDGGG
ncbi:MAG: peptidoglycan-binding protein [Acidimicrobiales bacterium]